MDVQEIQRRAWERGATAGNYAAAYGGLEFEENGEVLPPEGILSGEWTGESIPELIPETATMAPDDADASADAYEAAYGDAFVALATWAESDDVQAAPANPYDVDA